jgi:hypothetical protein
VGRTASRFVAEFVGAANILEGVSGAGTLKLRGGWLAIEQFYLPIIKR